MVALYTHFVRNMNNRCKSEKTNKPKTMLHVLSDISGLKYSARIFGEKTRMIKRFFF